MSQILSLRVLVCAGVWVLWSAMAEAQSVRVVILPKQTVEGKSVDESGLAAAASGALQRAGLRVIDLESALRAQRLALSDAVQSGRVPNELTVLNADVLISLQLRCAQSSAAVLASKIMAEQCGLDSKVVAASSGDVLYAGTQSLTGHGVSTSMALQSVLDKQLPGAVVSTSSTWLAALTAADHWEIDLSVLNVTDRATGRALAKQLTNVPGVSECRMLAYDRNLAKYALSGRGREQLEGLADAIEADPRLALTVTFDSARLLHAELDFVKAYRQRVMAMSVVPRDSELSSVGPELLRAALMNLPYLDMAHTLPLSAAPDNARLLEARLRDKARELHVPLLVSASFAPTDKAGWLATLKLVDAEHGRTLTAATGSAETSTRALDVAVRSFDHSFRESLQLAAVRSRFGLEDLAKQMAGDKKLVVQAFQLPERTRGVQAALHGTLELRNASDKVIKGATLQLTAAELALPGQALPDIPAGAALEVPVSLGAASLRVTMPVDVTATVTYPSGASYKRTEAVAEYIPGAAQNAKTATPDAMQEAESKRKAGDWSGALASYRRIDAADSNARTLFAMGVVELDLGAYGDAQRHLQAALQSTERALDPEQRRTARRYLVRAQASVLER